MNMVGGGDADLGFDDHEEDEQEEEVEEETGGMLLDKQTPGI